MKNRVTQFLHHISLLDRRWVFLAIFISVLLPLLLPYGFVARPSSVTVQFDKALEKALSTDKPILVDVDFGPQTQAEMEPMLLGVLHRLFKANRRVIFITFQTEAASLLKKYLSQMEAYYGLSYGEDYVFLGYATAFAYTMYGLGTSFESFFHEDDRGTPINDIPIMKDVSSLHDVGVVVNIASNALPKFWIQYAVAPHDIDFVAGTTAVQATEYYPYLHSGQLKGLLAGGKAAAEYEQLLVDKHIMSQTGYATKGLGAQTIALFTMLAFILVGNVGYFAGLRLKSREKR